MDRALISIAAYARLVRANRNFRRLWLAQIVSEIGDWFYSLSIYSLILQLTNRADLVGLAVVMQVLPTTFIGPTSGVVNDRISRRRVMIAADLVRMVIVLGMLLVRSREMVWLIYPLLLMETLMWGFFEPARSAVIPNLVNTEDVIVANTLSATTWSFNLVSGASLGGAVAALFGKDVVFVLNGLSFLVSAWLISGIHVTEHHVDSSIPLRAKDLVDYSPVLEGIRYIRSNARVLLTVFAKTGVGMLGANWVIFPILGKRVFPVMLHGLDPERGAMLGMSVLVGARGVGALTGPLVWASWAGRRDTRLRLGIFFGFCAAAIGYLCLARAPTLPLACASVMLAHAGGSVIWVFSTTLLQLDTQDRFRGRVFAAELGLSMLALSCTSYLAGIAVHWGVPVRTVAAATGCLMVAAAFLWSWAWRRVRSSRSGNDS